MNWYKAIKVSNNLTKLRRSEGSDWFNYYRQFMTEVKKILSSKSSLAAIATAASIILSTIDNFSLNEDSKQMLRNEVVQVQNDISSQLQNNEPTSDAIENKQESPSDTQFEEQLDDRFTYVKEQIKNHEDVRGYAYLDSEGVPTIGIGFNLTSPLANDLVSKLNINSLGEGVVSVDDLIADAHSDDKKFPLTDEQIDFLFNYSLEIAESDARKFLPNFDSYPDEVRGVITDMSFNLGYNRLMKFKKLRKALIEKDYSKAVDEMINSNWYNQVGKRSKNLVNILSKYIKS